MDGTIRSIGEDRSFILDLLRHAKKVPSFPVERRVTLDKVAEARRRCSRRVSWTAVFTRAYGLASRAIPELRQIYVPWPWPRLYQSQICVIAIAVSRTFPEGERLFFGRVHSPDLRSVEAIQGDLDNFQTEDVSKIFRTQYRLSKLPGLIRRLGWWWRMEVDYKKRPRGSGTGSISSLAGQGVTNRLHPCILTSSFSFGPLDGDQQSLVTLQCDHRVMDGTTAARALNSLCDYLTGQVLDELSALRSDPGK